MASLRKKHSLKNLSLVNLISTKNHKAKSESQLHLPKVHLEPHVEEEVQYDRFVDAEVQGSPYCNAFTAFRYHAAVAKATKTGFHRFSVYARYTIISYCFPAVTKTISLSRYSATKDVFSRDHFAYVDEVLDPVYGALSVNKAWRREFLTYFFNRYQFHVTLSPFTGPHTSPLSQKWLLRNAHMVQHLTVEFDLTRFGYCARSNAHLLRTLAPKIERLFREVVAALVWKQERPILRLHLMCRRHLDDGRNSLASHTVSEETVPGQRASWDLNALAFPEIVETLSGYLSICRVSGFTHAEARTILLRLFPDAEKELLFTFPQDLAWPAEVPKPDSLAAIGTPMPTRQSTVEYTPLEKGRQFTPRLGERLPSGTSSNGSDGANNTAKASTKEENSPAGLGISLPSKTTLHVSADGLSLIREESEGDCSRRRTSMRSPQKEASRWKEKNGASESGKMSAESCIDDPFELPSKGPTAYPAGVSSASYPEGFIRMPRAEPVFGPQGLVVPVRRRPAASPQSHPNGGQVNTMIEAMDAVTLTKRPRPLLLGSHQTPRSRTSIEQHREIINLRYGSLARDPSFMLPLLPLAVTTDGAVAVDMPKSGQIPRSLSRRVVGMRQARPIRGYQLSSSPAPLQFLSQVPLASNASGAQQHRIPVMNGARTWTKHDAGEDKRHCGPVYPQASRPYLEAKLGPTAIPRPLLIPNGAAHDGIASTRPARVSNLPISLLRSRSVKRLQQRMVHTLREEIEAAEAKRNEGTGSTEHYEVREPQRPGIREPRTIARGRAYLAGTRERV